ECPDNETSSARRAAAGTADAPSNGPSKELRGYCLGLPQYCRLVLHTDPKPALLPNANPSDNLYCGRDADQAKTKSYPRAPVPNASRQTHWMKCIRPRHDGRRTP